MATGLAPGMIVAMATTPPIQLKAGDKAPAFQSATQAGGQVALKDFKGKYVVLFFYPKDDTPG